LNFSSRRTGVHCHSDALGPFFSKSWLHFWNSRYEENIYPTMLNSWYKWEL
jgi:hypothetical protein